MIEFKESKFYKLLQDFFINNDKETFLQMLAEFYNRTEGILNKNIIQDELIKELRELYLEFNEKGLDENIVIEKVNYFVENNVKIKDIIAKLIINTNKIEDVNTKLNTNTNNIKNISSQLDTNTNKINGFITPNQFRTNENEIDDTATLQRAIDYAIANKVQLKSDLPSYTISDTLIINDYINIDFLNSEIKATNDNTMIYINYPNSLNETGYGTIENIVLNANNKNCNVIDGDYIAKTSLINIKIFNLKKRGIKLGIDGKGHEVLCDKIDIHGSGYDSVGIETFTSDCHFTDVIMFGCNKAIINRGSNIYDKVHAWLFNNITDSIFLDQLDGDVYMNNCCSDTYYIDFKRHDNARLCLNLFKSIINSDLYNLSNKYFFYIDTKEFESKNIDILQASRYIIIGNSLLKGYGDINCYLSNIPSEKFISKNLMDTNDFHGVVGIENAGISALALHSDVTIDGITSCYNKLTRRGNRVLCEGKVKLSNTSGLSGVITKTIGSFPKGYKPYYEKSVPVMVSDNEWSNNGCDLGIGNVGGELSFKYNCTNKNYPVFISYSFEYEIRFYE